MTSVFRLSGAIIYRLVAVVERVFTLQPCASLPPPDRAPPPLLVPVPVTLETLDSGLQPFLVVSLASKGWELFLNDNISLYN